MGASTWCLRHEPFHPSPVAMSVAGCAVTGFSSGQASPFGRESAASARRRALAPGTTAPPAGAIRAWSRMVDAAGPVFAARAASAGVANLAAAAIRLRGARAKLG